MVGAREVARICCAKPVKSTGRPEKIDQNDPGLVRLRATNQKARDAHIADLLHWGKG